MIKQMNYFGIAVDDVAETTLFFQEKLGLIVDEDESIPNRFTQFKLSGGATLALQSGVEQEGIEADIGQTFDVGLEVDDVDAAYMQWQEKGVDVLNEPHDMPFGRSFLVRVPSGLILRAYKLHANNNYREG